MAVTETGHAASREIDDLYRRHGGEVYRYALAVLGNHADAEDITQTTFLNAYRSLEQGVRPRKPSNWLLTIASNAIKQRFRQEQARPRQVELDDRIADRSSGVDGTDGRRDPDRALAIPPQQRQAIVLREFEGRSYKEIAEILNVSVSALETLLFRARRSLAEELEHQLTCTEAQFAVSQAADGRLGRKERRRLRVAPRGVSRLRTVRAGPETASAGTSRARVGSDSGLPHALPGLRGLGVGRDDSGDRCGHGGRGGLRQRGGRRRRRQPSPEVWRSRPRRSSRPRVSREGSGSSVPPRSSPRSRASLPPRSRSPESGSARRLLEAYSVPGRGVARGKANAPGQTKADKPRAEQVNSSNAGSANKGVRGQQRRRQGAGAGPERSKREGAPTKNATGQDRASKRVIPSPNRVRPNLAREKSRGKAVGPRKSPPSRSGKR